MSTECVRTNSVRLGILIRLNLVGFLLCPLGLRAETYVLKDSPEAVDSARADSSQKHTILLDTAHSYALWHVLTKTQPEKNELLQLETSSINGIINPEYQPQFQDIFQERRGRKAADDYYRILVSEVKSADVFVVMTVEQLGNYDFKSKTYPVVLTQRANDIVGPGASGVFYHPHGIPYQPYVYIEYNVPEEIRNVHISEKRAEILQPRINQSGVLIKLRLIQPHASVETSDDDLNIKVPHLAFKTAGADIEIPGGRSFRDEFIARNIRQHVGPVPSEIHLVSWKSELSNHKATFGNFVGSWKGAYSYTTNNGSNESNDIDISIQQDRAVLAAKSHIHYVSSDRYGTNKSDEVFNTDGSALESSGVSLMLDNNARFDGNIDEKGLRIIGEVTNGFGDKNAKLVLTKVDGGGGEDEKTNSSEEKSNSTRGAKEITDKQISTNPGEMKLVTVKLTESSEATFMIKKVGDGNGSLKLFLTDEAGYQEWKASGTTTSSLCGPAFVLNQDDDHISKTCQLDKGTYYLIIGQFPGSASTGLNLNLQIWSRKPE